MPVTFQSKTLAPVTLLNADAEKLLELMGMSGMIPSALRAADIPPVLERLRQAVARIEAAQGDAAPRDDDEVSVSLRAAPLIALLENAMERGETVMWERDTRGY